MWRGQVRREKIGASKYGCQVRQTGAEPFAAVSTRDRPVGVLAFMPGLRM